MINKILNIIYSMYFNFRYLPVEEAMKFPIIIYRHVQCCPKRFIGTMNMRLL